MDLTLGAQQTNCWTGRRATPRNAHLELLGVVREHLQRERETERVEGTRVNTVCGCDHNMVWMHHAHVLLALYLLNLGIHKVDRVDHSPAALRHAARLVARHGRAWVLHALCFFDRWVQSCLWCAPRKKRMLNPRRQEGRKEEKERKKLLHSRTPVPSSSTRRQRW